MGKRKCGQEKYSKILTGFLKDGESETISLNPEKVLSDIIQQAKKHFLLILMTKKYKKALP